MVECSFKNEVVLSSSLVAVTFIQLVSLIINISTMTHPGELTVAELRHYKTSHQ